MHACLLALSRIIDVNVLGDGFYGHGNWDYTGPLASAFTVDALSSSEISKLPWYHPDTKAADIKAAKEMLAGRRIP